MSRECSQHHQVSHDHHADTMATGKKFNQSISFIELQIRTVVPAVSATTEASYK